MVTLVKKSVWPCGKSSAMHEGSIARMEKWVSNLEACNNMYLERNTWAKMTSQANMWNSSQVNIDGIKQQHTFNKICTNANNIVHKHKCKLNNIHWKHNKNKHTIFTTYTWKCVGSEILLSESSNHTYTIDGPSVPIVECEVNATYFSKEIYSVL